LEKEAEQAEMGADRMEKAVEAKEALHKVESEWALPALRQNVRRTTLN